MRKLNILFFILITSLFSFSPLGEEIKIHYIDEGPDSTSIGYYNNSPESPNGRHIAYTKFVNHDKRRAQVWIYDKKSKVRKKIAELDRIGFHNGASTSWISNDLLMYMTGYRDAEVYSLEKAAAIQELHDGKIGVNSFNNKIIFNDFADEELQIIDVLNNNKKILLDRKRVLSYLLDMLNTDIDDFEVSFWNSKFSPDGLKIATRVDLTSEDYDQTIKFILINSLNGKILSAFSPTPLHFNWYDNNSLAGYNKIIGMNTLLRWDLSGSIISVVYGKGNHYALSEDKNYFASDNFYQESPVQLILSTKKHIYKIFEHKFIKETWDDKFHTNPSFSDDEKRLYFNIAVRKNLVRAAYIELEDLDE